MKAIDYIVDFIFDKIFKTSSLKILQPPKQEKSIYQKLKEKLNEENERKNIEKSRENDNKANLTRSILRNSNENISSTLNMRSSGRHKSIKFGEKSFITRTDEINLNDYATPKFIPEIDITKEKIIFPNPENNEQIKRREKSVRILNTVQEKNRDSILKPDNLIDMKNSEFVVRHPENIEDEKKEEDLASIVKTLRKKYDTSTQSRRSGRSMTLKEMILSKNKSNTSLSLTSSNNP